MSDKPEASQPDFTELTGRVYRLCLALLRREDEAADAAQEALARAWARRHQKRPEVSWWTWSCGFALRVCREAGRRRSGFEHEGEVGGLAATPAVLQELLPGPEYAALHAAILGLPRRQREVVTLRYLLEMSTRAVAEVLGCPTGTVKSNLHKALVRLQEKFERCGCDDVSHAVQTTEKPDARLRA